jgi:4-hydroxy-tetrahydrodipicolinate synthase
VPDLAAAFQDRVIPAVPVPFTTRGAIDRDAQQQYAGWMSRQPIGGVAIWAHTGRGLRLTVDERAMVLSDWRSALGDLPIVCGVGVPRSVRLASTAARRTEQVITHTVRLAEEARLGGAQAVMVHPPTALREVRGLDQRVVELHRAVAEVGLPVLAFYLYEAAGGVSYKPETIGRVLAIHGVLGIKLATLDSIMTFQRVAKVVSEIPSALLITGEDRFLGYSLMLGARSALIGMGAACTDVMADLLDAWKAGDLVRFQARSGAIDRFAMATFTEPMEGYVQRMLWALEAEGVLEAASDRFAPRLPPGERERVRQAVRTLRAS